MNRCVLTSEERHEVKVARQLVTSSALIFTRTPGGSLPAVIHAISNLEARLLLAASVLRKVVASATGRIFEDELPKGVD
jgi:hypothetical protein